MKRPVFALSMLLLSLPADADNRTSDEIYCDLVAHESGYAFEWRQAGAMQSEYYKRRIAQMESDQGEALSQNMRNVVYLASQMAFEHAGAQMTPETVEDRMYIECIGVRTQP